MKLLVTGATGFIGKNLLPVLLNNGFEVMALVRNESKMPADLNHTKLALVTTNNPQWKEDIKVYSPDVVIHLAAYLTSADNEQAINQLIESNILFATHILDALQETEISYFINTGTFAEYYKNEASTDPAYLYAATKTAFRSILAYYQSLLNFNIVNVIPYTVYGGIDTQKKLIDIIYQSSKQVIPTQMSPGEQLLDFIHIEDVVDFYLTLLGNLKSITATYTEIHLGTGEGTTPKQIARIIESVTNKKTNINWGGLPYRSRDTMQSVANKKLPSDVLSWTPKKEIHIGISEYINKLENKSNGF